MGAGAEVPDRRARRVRRHGRGTVSLIDARHYMRISSPRTPQIHLIESEFGGHLFVADGSRLFDADASLFASYRSAIDGGTEAIDELLRQAGLVARPFIDDTPLAPQIVDY